MSAKRRVALVTGASSGIGAATVRGLAAAAFETVSAARRLERCEELAREVGGRALRLDVADPDSVAALGDALPEVDLIVHCAGGALGLEPVGDADEERWREMWESNVAGVMRVTKALLPQLRAGVDPTILIVGSVAGVEVYEGGGGYTAAKHAAHALAQTLRLELLADSIRVGEIAPGLVETEFSLVRFGGDRERAAGVYAGLKPLSAEDVAAAIVFCATRPGMSTSTTSRSSRPRRRPRRSATEVPTDEIRCEPGGTTRVGGHLPSRPMHVDELLANKRPVFSIEFYPPKTEEGVAQLYATVEALKPLEPDYVSVTYGAGGATREGTLEVAERIKAEYGIEVMAHLSCVGETQEGLAKILDRFAEIGVENVLALRGDPPRGEQAFEPPPDGLSSATELTDFITERHEFSIGGACFPEVHPEADSPESDLAYLKSKVDAGASFLITQLFFDNAAYFDFVAAARQTGITVPIIPGVIPITSFGQVVRICNLCDASMPSELAAAMEELGGDVEAERLLGVAYAARQCEELLAKGAPGIHFYALNRAPETRAVIAALRASRPLGARLTRARPGNFRFQDRTIAFSEYGDGPRTVVLIHGLLMNRHMFDRLAPTLGEHGISVVSVDLLGHGDSEQPCDMRAYNMPLFAEQTAALIEYLELDRPIVGGTSLGANVALELAATRPELARGLLIEMPVLDNALVAAGLIFLPALLAMRIGRPLLRGVAALTRQIPRSHYLADVILDWPRRDPEASEAVLSGILFGRTAPPREERERIELPTLIIGHRADPLHPFSDADMLLAELPEARLVNAESIIEWRIKPARLDAELIEFVDQVYAAESTASSPGVTA